MNHAEDYYLRRIEDHIAKKDTAFINLAMMAYQKKYFSPAMYESFYLEGLSFACSQFNHSWHLLYAQIGLDVKTASGLLEDFLLWQYLPHHDSINLNNKLPIYMDDSLEAGMFFSGKLMDELEFRAVSNMAIKNSMEKYLYMNKENYTIWLASQLPENEDNEPQRAKCKV